MNIFHQNNEIIIENRYKLFPKQKLGVGTFGEVFEGEEISSRKKVAIKIENTNKNSVSLLKSETKILLCLQGGIGIPKIYSFKSIKSFNLMIFQLLGNNLNELFHICHKKFSQKTILSLGLQMLDRIEYIHSRHIIHRDIKLENFLIDNNTKEPTVYIIDFGLSKRFRDVKTGMHIPYIEGKKFTGTLTYASVYTHLGIEQSRRDDLESLAYILIYLNKGILPWKGIKAKNQNEKMTKILNKKMSIKDGDLLSGLPEQYSILLHTIRDLHFEQKPDYDYLRNLLNQMNTDSIPLKNVKYDFINFIEKKNMYDKHKFFYYKKDVLNFNESKKETKSNTNIESFDKISSVSSK